MTRTIRLFTPAIALVAVCYALPLNAQQIAQRAGLSAPGSISGSIRPSWFDSRSVTPNNWLKGTLIGAGVGLGVGLIVTLPVENNETMFILGSTVLCAVIGGLIGSGSHKH